MAANTNLRPKSLDISSYVSGKILFWSMTILRFNLNVNKGRSMLVSVAALSLKEPLLLGHFSSKDLWLSDDDMFNH